MDGTTDAEAQRSLNGYITFIRNQHLGREEFGDKALHDGVVPYYVTMPDSPFPDFQSPPLITDHRSPITDP